MASHPPDWYSDRFIRLTPPDVFRQELPQGEGPTVLARAIYREVRSRYHGLCLEWNTKTAWGHGLDKAFPFLDRDLVQFVMTVPGDVLTRDGVPKALLRGALAGTVPDAVLQRRSKGDFTEVVNEASRRDFPAIAAMLGPDSLVVQMNYVDADKLKKGLAASEAMLATSSSCTASWNLSGLVALELWLREFVEPPGTRQEDVTPWRNNEPTPAV